MRMVLIILLIFCLAPAAVSAEKEYALDETELVEIKPYEYPEIKPEISLYGGYRHVNLSGAARVEEYEYLHNSISLGGELRAFSFPHRLHFDLDFKNRKDYFGDVSYAYRDVILFRGINRTLFHNLENITLLDLEAGTLSPGVAVRDVNERYGTKTGMSSVFLRFKTPDFPAHLYIDGTFIERSGDVQQRFMGGSGWWNNIVRVSQKRNVDQQTKEITIGANSHLGPLEVEFSHSEKRFEAGGDKVLFEAYGPAGFPPFLVVRQAGVFPHNLTPELKGSSDTIKIHTSYTGALVASATFSRIERENRDSGAKADYFIGAGEVTWVASTNLTVFLKYRHKEVDVDNPDSVTITDRTNLSNSYTYSNVKQSVSSVNDIFSGIVRYRPIKGLALRGEYSYENTRRKDAADWTLPDSTQKNTVALSADLRVIKGLNLKAKYTHKDINNPSTNMQPDHSDEGKVSISWIPLPKINALVTYSIAKEKRNGLLFLDELQNPISGPEKRDVTRESLLGNITFLVLKDLSLTASYANMHNKVQQDIAYNIDGILPPGYDSMVPYKNTAHNYGLDVSYIPKKNMTFNAGVSHTIASGKFYPSDVNLVQPVSIASFSELKTRETAYSASGEYQFNGGITAGIQYRYNTFKDLLDNIYDDANDGRSSIILLTISKKW